MKVSDILIYGKSLIDTPDKWTQGTMARDESGREVSAYSTRATCFCSIGALCKTVDDKQPPEEDWSVLLESANIVLDEVTSALHYEYTSHYNDNHTHEEVMAMWDKAIEMAKEVE